MGLRRPPEAGCPCWLSLCCDHGCQAFESRGNILVRQIAVHTLPWEQTLFKERLCRRQVALGSDDLRYQREHPGYLYRDSYFSKKRAALLKQRSEEHTSELQSQFHL